MKIHKTHAPLSFVFIVMGAIITYGTGYESVLMCFFRKCWSEPLAAQVQTYIIYYSPYISFCMTLYLIVTLLYFWISKKRLPVPYVAFSIINIIIIINFFIPADWLLGDFYVGG